MRWIPVPAVVVLLSGAAALASPATPDDDPTINRPLTAMEIVEWHIDRAVDMYGHGDFAAADPNDPSVRAKVKAFFYKP